MTVTVSNSAGPVVLDASVWISSISSMDSNHAPALAWTRRHLNQQGYFLVPTIFQLEVAAAIARNTRNVQMANNAVARLGRLESLNGLRYLPIDDLLIQASTNFAILHRIRAADAMYAAVAQQNSIPLVTFDAELLRLPPNVVATIRP